MYLKKVPHLKAAIYSAKSDSRRLECCILIAKAYYRSVFLLSSL